MRRVALLSIALTAGCNSILDIPERSLLVEDDTGAETSFTVDSTVKDTTSIDTSVEETSVDSAPTDSEADADATSEDTLVTDSAADTTDGTVEDTATTDTGTADTTTTDTATTDTATTDTATTDTAMPDTSTPTCGVTGKPCCGSPTAGMCDKNSVCASGSCIAAAGSCVRASDCAGVCTGPSICAGNVCFSCGAAAGSGALWSACASSAECLLGPCDRTRGVCSSACAPGITGDADCTSLDPKAICTAPNITVTSSSTTATGYVGFCARSCQHDADCRTSESCRLAGNSLMGRLDLTCAPSPTTATVDIGGTCTDSNDCKRGICLTLGSTKQCTPLCSVSADCTAGTWKNCNAYSFGKPGGGTQIVYACGT